MKNCTKCGELKPLSAFSKHRLTKDGHAYQCKECNRKRTKIYNTTPDGTYTRIKSRVKFRGKTRDYHKLHISRDDFREWYNAQPRVCHYCSISEEQLQFLTDAFNNFSRKLTVDCKDNELGYARGNMVICCRRCNAIKSDILTYEEMLYIGQNFLRPKWIKMMG